MNDTADNKPKFVKCFYRKVDIPIEDAIKFGGFVDCGPDYVRYYHKDEIETHKQNRKAFDHSERNCNTCIHLQRIKHEKSPYGFLQGKCSSTPINHPYESWFSNYDGNLVFHPNDPLHLECYVPRNP